MCGEFCICLIVDTCLYATILHLAPKTRDKEEKEKGVGEGWKKNNNNGGDKTERDYN